MRIEEVFENNKKLPTKVQLNTEEGRQLATLSVLTDISETLAMMLDMYGVVHGREVNLKKDGKKNAEQ